MKRRGCLGFAMLLVTGVLQQGRAQDLHFSQFFNSPLTTNPANTGFMPDANYRIGINYRDQWATVPVPYKTFSAYGDAQVLRDRWYAGWLGLGGVILQDNSGDGTLSSTAVYASVAYHQLLGSSSLLTAGFNAGLAMKRLDVSKLSFPSQFNDNFGKWFFDTQIPSGENLVSSNITYLDIQAGMNYAYFPTDHIYLNMGFSAQHLNEPRETFLASGSNQIPRRYIGFLNASIMLTPSVILNPGGYYTTQSGAEESVFGGWAAYNLSGPGGEYQLLGGMYYRVGDSFIPVLGYQMKQWRIMFSYDVTSSSFSQADHQQGAYELSLTYLGIYASHIYNHYNEKTYLCPHF